MATATLYSDVMAMATVFFIKIESTVAVAIIQNRYYHH